MKPVACILNEDIAPLGILRDVLEERGTSWCYVDARDERKLPELAGVSGLIVLGGGMNVDQFGDYPFLGPVRDLVGEAIESSIPLLGICLGAQILTRALGGEVTPLAFKEIGFVPVLATEAGHSDEILAPFAPSAEVFQFHEDSCSLPSGCELLFEGAEVPIQAFKVEGRPAWGVQFHFEITRTEIAAWCDDVADLESSWGTTKDRLLEQAREKLAPQQKLGREVAGRFLDLVES